MQANIRQTKSSDHPAINVLGTASYPENYHEGYGSFESKMIGYPEGCFVADLYGIVGYVISFPYLLGRPYPIDEHFFPVEKPECYYIHDLCVAEEFRGKKIASGLAEKVLEKKWQVFALVAVLGSGRFWERFGFRSFAVIDYYGRKAEYMLLIRD